jgi:hypothetical protein
VVYLTASWGAGSGPHAGRRNPAAVVHWHDSSRAGGLARVGCGFARHQRLARNRHDDSDSHRPCVCGPSVVADNASYSPSLCSAAAAVASRSSWNAGSFCSSRIKRPGPSPIERLAHPTELGLSKDQKRNAVQSAHHAIGAGVEVRLSQSTPRRSSEPADTPSWPVRCQADVGAGRGADTRRRSRLAGVNRWLSQASGWAAELRRQSTVPNVIWFYDSNHGVLGVNAPLLIRVGQGP